MRKYSNLLMSGCVMIAVALTISACKDDDPPVPPTVKFEASTMTVKESDGVVQVKVVLDKPAPEDITVTYSLAGTAWEEVAAAGQHNYDYTITSDYKEVTIAKGESEGIIELELLSDFDFELEDETIELAIESVTPAEVIASVPDDIDITVTQEDGLLVALAWGEEGVAYTDVDMDLSLWQPGTGGSLTPNLNFYGSDGDFPTSLVLGVSPRIEYFFLPTAVVSDGTYGIGATYYSGTREPMKFAVSYVKVVNGANAGEVEKQGTYTLMNVNPWDKTAEGGVTPLLAGTFKKTGSDFTEFSDLTIPAENSRSSSFVVPANIRRKPSAFELHQSFYNLFKTKK